MTILVIVFPNSLQWPNVISLFFDNFLIHLRLFSERDFNLKLTFCSSATRERNLLFISKLRFNYSYIRHLS